MRKRCGPWPVSSESLQVRSHHVRYPADFRGSPQLGNRRLPAPERLSESLDCNVEPNLVSILETIRDRLRHRIDANRNSLYVMCLPAELERWFREADNTPPRTVRARPAILFSNCHPH